MKKNTSAQHESKQIDNAPLLIPVCGTLTLRESLRQRTDAVVLLDPRGLHAESVQRAERRFLDFYSRAASLAESNGGEPLFLCSTTLSAPAPLAKAPHPFFSRELLLSQLTALLRVSAVARMAPILPYADSGEQFHALHALLDTAMCALFEQDVPFDELLPVGALPASFEILAKADLLLEEADFLLIDTNLPWTGSNATLLSLLRKGIAQAHQMGRPVLLYGARALAPTLLPELLAAGIDGLCLPPDASGNCFGKERLIFQGIT